MWVRFGRLAIVGRLFLCRFGSLRFTFSVFVEVLSSCRRFSFLVAWPPGPMVVVVVAEERSQSTLSLQAESRVGFDRPCPPRYDCGDLLFSGNRCFPRVLLTNASVGQVRKGLGWTVW